MRFPRPFRFPKAFGESAHKLISMGSIASLSLNIQQQGHA
jgi:hypothetical protein